MKKQLTLLTLAMLLVLAACGNKTEAPASAGTSANASKETETGTSESIVGEASEAIEEAAKPQQGDVTNKMYFTKDVSFTSSTPLEFVAWNESGSSTAIYYEWKEEDHYAYVTFGSGDGYIVDLFDPLNTPEGAYQGTMSYEGCIELKFQTEDKDGEKYEIRVVSADDINTYKPDEEYVKLFQKLVEEFLVSGVVTDAKMSDIQYDTAVLSETNTANFFTSPDAIAAE